MTLTSPLSDDEIIFAYTRSEALNDGVLVELSDQIVSEAGIRVKVAVTRAVWDEYLAPDYLNDLSGQSVDGRTWDLLWMFGCAARRSRHARTIQFRVLFATMKGSGSFTIDDILLKAVCGPGDEGEPVITIMLPEED